MLPLCYGIHYANISIDPNQVCYGYDLDIASTIYNLKY